MKRSALVRGWKPPRALLAAAPPAAPVTELIAGTATLAPDLVEAIMAGHPLGLAVLRQCCRALRRLADTIMARPAYAKLLEMRMLLLKCMWRPANELPKVLERAVTATWADQNVPSELATLLRHFKPIEQARDNILGFFAAPYEEDFLRDANRQPPGSYSYTVQYHRLLRYRGDTCMDDQGPGIMLALCMDPVTESKAHRSWSVMKKPERSDMLNDADDYVSNRNMIRPASEAWHSRACARHPLRCLLSQGQRRSTLLADWCSDPRVVAARTWQDELDLTCDCLPDVELHGLLSRPHNCGYRGWLPLLMDHRWLPATIDGMPLDS
jgi:hypothetical protein